MDFEDDFMEVNHLRVASEYPYIKPLSGKEKVKLHLAALRLERVYGRHPTFRDQTDAGFREGHRNNQNRLDNVDS
jgi:hypothetical protein